MANGHTLLDAVCEAPDDDGPRLIYADLLDERGDPRGEFIRVQLALAKLPPADPRRPELIAREKELLDDHRDEWLAPFRRLVSAAEFRRGFVEDVKVSVWHFVAFADALFATGPVRRAHLLDIHPAEGLRVLQVVLESPHVARLTGLTITNTRLGEPLARTLATAPGLAGLKSLDMTRNELGDGGAAELASGSCLGSLEELDLTGNEIGGQGAEALANARHWSRLRRLTLNQNAAGSTGAVRVAGTDSLPKLDRLELAGNRVGDRLAETPNPSALLRVSRLDLSDNGLTADGVQLVLADSVAAGVRYLDLSHNPLGDAGVAVLAESPHAAGLHTLRLSHARVRNAGVVALARSPYLSRLTALDLSNNPIGEEGGQALLASKELPQLRRLVMPAIGLSIKVRLALTAKYARGPVEC